MKLALVYPDLTHKGGAESVVVWTACGLARRGHEVRIFTEELRADLWPDQPELAGLVECIPWSERGKRDERARHTGHEIAARLNEFPLIYAHNRYGLLASLEAKSPVVWYCQEPSRRRYPRLTDRFLIEAWQRPDMDLEHPAIVQIDVWLRRREKHWLRRLKTRMRHRADIRLVKRPVQAFVNSEFSAGVFEDCFHRKPQVLDLGLPALPEPPQDQPRRGLVMVASHSPKKNVRSAIQAMAELERRGSELDVPLEIWGIGTDDEEFRDLVREHGVESRVQLIGYLPDQEARQKLAAARLCLALPICEPFGLVVIEALQLQTPVLVSHHGGPAEIVEHCGGGERVDCLRPAEIADAVESILLSPQREQALRDEARRARARVQAKFDMELYLDRTEQALEAILAS